MKTEINYEKLERTLRQLRLPEDLPALSFDPDREPTRGVALRNNLLAACAGVVAIAVAFGAVVGIIRWHDQRDIIDPPISVGPSYPSFPIESSSSEPVNSSEMESLPSEVSSEETSSVETIHWPMASAAQSTGSPSATSSQFPSGISEPIPSESTPSTPTFGGRLLSLLPEAKYGSVWAQSGGIGLGGTLDKYATIFQLDWEDDIFYSTATGEKSYYVVYRTPEQGLMYLFFSEYTSITAGAVGADGQWQPFNYLVRKGGEADGELGRWLNGIWTPWEGEVTDAILQGNPSNTLAALLDDAIYEGEWEVRRAPLDRLTHGIYVTGAHSYADFSGLSAENTLDDVYAIDSAIQRKWVSEDNPFTLHMLTDGMLVVRYVYDQEQSEFFVSKLYYYPDYVVDGSVVFYGEERGGTLYDFSILPEDRFWE